MGWASAACEGPDGGWVGCLVCEGPRFGLGVQMDSPDIYLSIPEDWTPEESKDLLQAYEGAEDTEIRYEFVKNENGMDVY